MAPAATAYFSESTSSRAMPIQAQDGVFEDIVVTATRREAGVQDIPFNISAISGDQIDRDRINNIADLARRVPGLQLVDQGPRNPSPLIVRGLTVNALTIQSVHLYGDVAEADALGIASALEMHSAHPLARAFRGTDRPKR